MIYQADNKERAEHIAMSRRCVLPIAYTDKKRKAAECKIEQNQFNEKNDCGTDEMNDLESKIVQRQKIQQQMESINGLYFDLSESDVEDFQNLLDESSEEEHELVPIVSVSDDAQINVGALNHVRLSAIQEDEAPQNELNQLIETDQTLTENGQVQLANQNDDGNMPFSLNFSGESVEINSFDSDNSSTHNPKKIESLTTQKGDDVSPDFEFIPSDAKLPVPCTSKIEFDREFEFDRLNPSIMAESQNEISNDEAKARSKSADGKSVERNEDFTRFFGQENIYTDPVALHNAMHLHFPGECSLVSIKIYFSHNIFSKSKLQLSFFIFIFRIKMPFILFHRTLP